jgi:hypothetical protein
VQLTMEPGSNREIDALFKVNAYVGNRDGHAALRHALEHLALNGNRNL